MQTDRELLAAVRVAVLRELDGLELSSLVLRLDVGADRSVFVAARLGDGSCMVTRVFEVDLTSGLSPVYLSPEDGELLVESLSRERRQASRPTRRNNR